MAFGSVTEIRLIYPIANIMASYSYVAVHAVLSNTYTYIAN